jgi:hypothetical protein
MGKTPAPAIFVLQKQPCRPLPIVIAVEQSGQPAPRRRLAQSIEISAGAQCVVRVERHLTEAAKVDFDFAHIIDFGL